MPTAQRQIAYLVINNPKMFEWSLSGRLGKLTSQLLSHATKPKAKEAAAKKLWNAVLRNPISRRNPMSLEHLWYLVNSNIINFNRAKDVSAFCALLNNNSVLREIFIKLVLIGKEDSADLVKTENMLSLPAKNLKNVDLLALTAQEKSLERSAVNTLKFHLTDPVVMSRFVDGCSSWLVNLNPDILRHMFNHNHAAVRFLNPESFGIPYAHAPRHLQEEFREPEDIFKLLVRDVSDVPPVLVKPTEQYYFTMVLRFAYKYQPIYLKGLLEQVATDYPENLSPEMQIIRKRIFQNSPNLYLSSFLASEEEVREEDHHHHHHGHHHHDDHSHHHHHAQNFDLFVLLCGKKGLRYPKRLSNLLHLRKDPLAYFIDLINLAAPNQNAVSFFLENITDVFPVIAKNLSGNGRIAFSDVVSREFYVEGKAVVFCHVYQDSMRSLVKQFLKNQEKLSPREKAELFLCIKANLEIDTLRGILILDDDDIQALLNDPIYGESIEPFVARSLWDLYTPSEKDLKKPFIKAAKSIQDNVGNLSAFIQNMDHSSVAESFLLASEYWDMISPRANTIIGRIGGWLSQNFGVFEKVFSEIETTLASQNRFFAARLAYEKTKKQIAFDQFLGQYTLQHWGDDVVENDVLLQLVITLSNENDVASLFAYKPKTQETILASPHLKAKLLDAVAAGKAPNALNTLMALIDNDPKFIQGYLEDVNFQSQLAKVLKTVKGFDYEFLSRIVKLDPSLFVQMLDGRAVEFAEWIFKDFTYDWLDLLCQCSHNNFCVRVFECFLGWDENFIYHLLQEENTTFKKACENQPHLAALVLNQSKKTRDLFYEQSFDLVAEMFDTSVEPEINIPNEALNEIENITFRMLRQHLHLTSHHSRESGNLVQKQRAILDKLFQHAPRFLFRDAQEEELWYLYQHVSDLTPLFEKSFVASHRPAVVQMFCDHILDVDMDYWPVIFNDKESLETVFTVLNDEQKVKIIELLKQCPNKSMFYKLVRLESPALDGFLNRCEEYEYSNLRSRHAMFMQDHSVETSSDQALSEKLDR